MTLMKSPQVSTSLLGDGADLHSTPSIEHIEITPAVKATIRVLVVDDDRTLREGCASVLAAEGYNVTVCGRGDEAMEVVRQRRFDLVLVDLYMTPSSGLEVLRATLDANRS